jgi:hypothetical protein
VVRPSEVSVLETAQLVLAKPQETPRGSAFDPQSTDLGRSMAGKE